MQKKIPYFLYFVLELIFIFSSYSQSNFSKKTNIDSKNGIDNISLLSTHPFGIFIARSNPNFKFHPPKSSTLNFTVKSGNNWAPPVWGFLPKNEADRNLMKNTVWSTRAYRFNRNTMPADSLFFQVDAVIKGFIAKLNFRLSASQELDISLRSFLITKGRYPFSFFTNDEFIEFFHSNIAGGEDPFARRFYGLDKEKIKYIDENGNKLELNNGTFLLPGLSADYYYYPKFLINKKRNFFVNFGTHFGANFSKFNTSIDIGISTAATKKMKWNNKNLLIIGLGTTILRKNIIRFNTNLDLGNNKYIANFQTEIEYTKKLSKKSYQSFGIVYTYQTSYNHKNQIDYLVLIGNRVKPTWHHGLSHLYYSLTNYTFIYSYHKNFTISVYLKEDFKINNQPDLQTGIGLIIPLKK